ncbi:MAG: DUF262 domain-containing protein [Solobacterium sp.]|nr:DUF262 domain-containing protein [Solobacterium sp.]
MTFKAQEEKIMELFSRKIYNIPRNQRKYVWNENHWQELFDDVMIATQKGIESHFIGSVVLKTDGMINGLNRYLIIDGQQRCITITIFLTSIMFWMKKLGMDDDFNGTMQYIIAKDDKNKDVVMVTAENNASLENIIDAIVNLKDDTAKNTSVNAIVEKNTINKADKNIGKAFIFYMNAINDTYINNNYDKQLILKIRNTVRNISLISIIASTEEDSYTIFEILNARGSDLEDHELLKNYIMRYIQPEENRDKAKIEWNRMATMLGDSNINRFIRHYTNHRYGDYKSKTVTSYKTIQNNNKGKDTWDLLKDLERKAGFYTKLIAPCVNGEDANCSIEEYRVYSFFKKKRQEQVKPVLLSLITQFEEGNITKRTYEEAISFLYNYYVCYSIIGEESSNRLTDTLNKYAAKINRDGSEDTISRFKSELVNKLPTESVFKNSFRSIGWSHHNNIYEGEKNKTKVQIVLEILERYLNNGICYDEFTIEHVYDDSEGVNNGQIGNLLPLEEHLNKRCIGKSFAEKLVIYSESSFYTTRSFSKRFTEQQFNPEKRTEYLADLFYKSVLKNKFD